MDAEQVWLAALERVRHRISPGAYSTWFSTARGLELTGAHLTIAAPSAFTAEHLRKKFHEIARVAVSEVIRQSAELTFVVRNPASSSMTDMQSSPQAQRPSNVGRRSATGAPRRHSAPALTQHAAAVAAPRSAPSETITQPQRGPMSAGRSRRLSSITQPPLLGAVAPAVSALDAGQPERAATSHDLYPPHVFENYIVGTGNRLAYAAAQEVADAPGQSYNPLLIYGGVGLGKTHLLHAIGNRAQRAGHVVAYVTAERFTNEIIEAIRQRRTEEFRARYRQVDVLLVDDVQFIAGKESTEEEFFHTFNALHEFDKQIVLSSDAPPQAMRHLHDRLRSRFAWGLVADIQAPDFEHRLEILRAKAIAQRVDVPEEALVRLARPECESVRALEGTLTRVIASARVLNQPLDARLITQALAPLETAAKNAPIEPAHIVDAVAKHYGFTVADLQGKGRERAVAWARQIAMYLLREDTSCSLPQIGHILGGRDHTTVMHGCARIGKAIAQDARARDDLSAIRASLRG